MFADITFLGLTLGAFWIAFIFVLWILAAFLPASIAKSKGYSFIGWFIISLFFWWITLFVALIMKKRTPPTPTAAPSY